MSIIADALKFNTPAVFSASAATSQTVFQSTAGGALVMGAPGSLRLAGQQFWVSAVGYASGGAGTYTATIQPILYGDASLATVTTKPLFSCTAGTLAYTGTAVAGATIPWNIFAQFEGDNVSQIFYGNVEGQAGATYKAPTVSVAPVSTINFATEPPMKFAVGMTTVGTLGAAPKIVLTQFQIIQE